MSLHVSPDLELPDEAITQTFGILAKRGVGKTYTASVMTEEMLKAKLPVVVCDPIGVWWGLRSSASGKSDGLPIIVLGGDHGDAPLEETAGSVIADLVVDERVSLVLDLSLFRKAGQVRFMTDFSERLYQRNRQPLHLMLDEADAFAPQRPMKGAERLLGAIEDLVRRGRARGLGMTLITQRPAVLNKNVLTQIEVLVTLRMVAPQDRGAIDEWIRVHGEPEQREELMASLPSLPIGTAWFWSPGWLDLFRRVRVRERETFDSSATPEMGAAVEPRKMADVDLAALQERMAATIERAKAEDPKRLQRKVRELEAKLAAQEPERIEVPVLTDDAREALTRAAASIDDAQRAMIDAVAEASQQLSTLLDSLGAAQAAPAPPRGQRLTPRTTPAPRAAPPRATAAATLTAPVEGDLRLGKAHRAILTILAQYPDGRTKRQLALQAGYSERGGGFNNPLGALRSAGYVTRGEPILATDEGLAALGDWDELPSGPALLEHWLSQREVGKAGRAILTELAAVAPDALDKNELAARCGYEPNGGGFNNPLGRLRTLGLVVKGLPLALTPEFAEAIQ